MIHIKQKFYCAVCREDVDIRKFRIVGGKRKMRTGKCPNCGNLCRRFGAADKPKFWRFW